MPLHTANRLVPAHNSPNMLYNIGDLTDMLALLLQSGFETGITS